MEELVACEFELWLLSHSLNPHWEKWYLVGQCCLYRRKN